MSTYIKFFFILFFKSLLYVLTVMICLVFILNLLGELEFFRNTNADIYFTLFLAFLNSPSMIFEMFPFIFLITSQLFFIKLLNNNELETLKYSGLKNSKILSILTTISFFTGVLIVLVFYNFSSNLKNIYLELKSPFTNDGKYLAVVTKNGLWIRDKIGENIIVINSSKIDNNYLIDNFITIFDDKYNVLKNINSNKIDITNYEWLVYDPKIYKKNNYENKEFIILNTNFNYKRIQSLFSNLTSLSVFELYELRENYKKLNYSITDLDLQLLKLVTNPFYLVLMSLFSGVLMIKIKKVSSTAMKISFGLFFSVVIYYINNFFFVLGSTEKLSIIFSIFTPLIMLTFINIFMLNRINEK